MARVNTKARGQTCLSAPDLGRDGGTGLGQTGREDWEMDGPIRLNQVRKGGQMVLLKKPVT